MHQQPGPTTGPEPLPRRQPHAPVMKPTHPACSHLVCSRQPCLFRSVCPACQPGCEPALPARPVRTRPGSKALQHPACSPPGPVPLLACSRPACLTTRPASPGLFLPVPAVACRFLLPPFPGTTGALLKTVRPAPASRLILSRLPLHGSRFTAPASRLLLPRFRAGQEHRGTGQASADAAVCGGHFWGGTLDGLALLLYATGWVCARSSVG